MRIPILTTNGAFIVDTDFLSSQSPTQVPDVAAHIEYVSSGEDPALDSLAQRFNNLADNDKVDKPSTDGEMAAFIHQNLKLSRFEASHHQFWHYLTVVKCQKYVIWRWRKEGAVPKRQYVGPWWRNALGRLWWWAEVTHDPDSDNERYRRTIRAAGSQEFMRDTIENLLCGNRNLVRALCDTCFPGKSDRLTDREIREIIKRINALLVTTTIDSLNENEVNNLVMDVYKNIRE